MASFSYSDPSVATEWLRNYTRDMDSNIALLSKLAPAPESLIITRTSPLTNHRLQSAVNMAIRKHAAKRCIPMIDWEALAHVHMLDDRQWAQQKQVCLSMLLRVFFSLYSICSLLQLKGWYADTVHPNPQPTLSYGFTLLRFVRYYVHSLRHARDPDFVEWTEE